MTTFKEFWEAEEIATMLSSGEILDLKDFSENYLKSEVEVLTEETNFKLVRVHSSNYNCEHFILYDNDLYDEKAFSKQDLCSYLSFQVPKNLEELVEDLNNISNFERVQIWYDFHEQRYWIDDSQSCMHDFNSACLKVFSRGEKDWTEDDLSLIFDQI